MTAQIPSIARSVKIYPGGRGQGQGLLGPNAILNWPEKHPLDSSWWWIDASGLCTDLGDTLIQLGCSVVSGDSALTVPATSIGGNGSMAGFKLCQGTPNTSYTIRCHLTFAMGTRVALDVGINLSAVQPVPTPNPSYITQNQDIVLLAGIPFPSGH